MYFLTPWELQRDCSSSQILPVALDVLPTASLTFSSLVHVATNYIIKFSHFKQFFKNVHGSVLINARSAQCASSDRVQTQDPWSFQLDDIRIALDNDQSNIHESRRYNYRPRCRVRCCYDRDLTSIDFGTSIVMIIAKQTLSPISLLMRRGRDSLLLRIWSSSSS